MTSNLLVIRIYRFCMSQIWSVNAIDVQILKICQDADISIGELAAFQVKLLSIELLAVDIVDRIIRNEPVVGPTGVW